MVTRLHTKAYQSALIETKAFFGYFTTLPVIEIVKFPGKKQLTESEKCQWRAARAQRNHLAGGYPAWVSLKVKAKELVQPLYALCSSLFSSSLQAELRLPRIVAC